MGRSKFDLIREILDLAGGGDSGTTISEVKRKVGMNYHQAARYLSHLKGKGVLRVGKRGNPENVYTLSDAGRELRKKMKDISGFL